MGRPESVLGKQADRIKTDMRLPRQLAERMQAMAKHLGVAANVVHTMSAAYFLANFAQLVPDPRGKDAVINDLEKMFSDIFKFIREKNERKG